MKNFIDSGDLLEFTASADVTSGQVVVLGNGLAGVATGDVANGEEGVAKLTGRYTLPKTSANTPSQWDKAYWNATAGEVTTTSTSNTLIGLFSKAAGSGETEAEVLLRPNIV